MSGLLITVLAFGLVSCAGPTTPFGSNFSGVYRMESKKNFRSISSLLSNPFKLEEIKIDSYPKTKIYHDNFNLTFKVTNPNGLRTPFQYNILYNGKIVEKWLKNETIRFNQDRTEAIVTFKNISLLPGIKNEITFLYYDKENHAPLYYDLTDPKCSINESNTITNINPFIKKSYLIKKLNNIAKNNSINPLLLASLVAQESSFNPKAVSIARAVGLTQVTPIADRDIRSIDPSFKSYPNNSHLSYIDLKYKIYRGVINAKNDWRLNETKSLKGGAIYLKQIKDYWTSTNNLNFLEKNLNIYSKLTPKETHNIKTDIILASYNSGASRVKRNIEKHKDEWIWSGELGEARKYVNNIKSYCNHFKK